MGKLSFRNNKPDYNMITLKRPGLTDSVWLRIRSKLFHPELLFDVESTQ